MAVSIQFNRGSLYSWSCLHCSIEALCIHGRVYIVQQKLSVFMVVFTLFNRSCVYSWSCLHCSIEALYIRGRVHISRGSLYSQLYLYSSIEALYSWSCLYSSMEALYIHGRVYIVQQRLYIHGRVHIVQQRLSIYIHGRVYIVQQRLCIFMVVPIQFNRGCLYIFTVVSICAYQSYKCLNFNLIQPSVSLVFSTLNSKCFLERKRTSKQLILFESVKFRESLQSSCMYGLQNLK